ncbi:HisA/HisF-related TIM barrel protein [Aliarcobacter cryaerophilus]|uniref:HisA/HisF-related TIM barrel protein n=1 Tax=Aliarcobacter cryaerophilus TaxID=28198 RepID=UPI0021B565E7|nr:HisA/HisF-related TIM barrel protein [Aliarcobacter cryaerophilus]MCT7529649.1 HisA/HisF-related TIM barrel protein [Aliarcobacter cryaerophilus]
MLRKRIIFTLVYENGFFNQSRNFRLQKVGNITWLEKNYNFKDIAFSLDELIVLNASKDKKNIQEFGKVLSELVNNVFIPIAAGGGIRTVEDARFLFENGADKLVINTILYEKPDLVKELVKIYGSQSLVACIDYKKINMVNKVFINDGKEEIEFFLEEYLKYVQSLGVGEIYFNSIEKDGTGFGYDMETIEQISDIVKVPLIIAGGAGNEKHLIDGLSLDCVSAVATANLFNFIGNGLPNARRKIIDKNMNIARWI